MDSPQGMVCLQNDLVQGVSVTCFVLATECLTKNVAHNLQLVCSFPCIMLMQFFKSYSYLLGSGYFKVFKWQLNTGDFSIHWYYPTFLFYYFSCRYQPTFLFYYFPRIFILFTYFSNPHASTQVSGLLFKAGLRQGKE